MTGDAIGGSGLLYFIFSSIYSGIFFRIMLEMYSLVTQVKNIYKTKKWHNINQRTRMHT